MTPLVAQTRLWLQDETERPLGRVTLASCLKSSQGTGFQRMRVLGRYALVYTVAGAGRYRDALGNRARLSPGDALLIFPEVPHSYGPLGGPWDEAFLVFEGELFDSWRTQQLISPLRPFAKALPVEQHFAALAAFSVQPRPQTVAAHLAQLAELMALLTSFVNFCDAPTAQLDWMVRARAALESNLELELRGTALAHQLGLSYDRFRKDFTRCTGQSPAEFRMAARMRAARALLQNTRLTHAAIASSLGFTDEFHFSRQFKQHEKMAPREYRRAIASDKPATDQFV